MIEANALTRRFGTFTAVQQVSLRVPDGAILALLGQNGAGKTTTVRMLAGLLAPSEGEAIVAGYDVRRQGDAVRACVGLATDVPGLFEQMNVPAYLDFFGTIYGMPPVERKRRIDELIEFFELTEQRSEKMAGFSKGMKQKVALARAIMHQPAVLFLDEPTSGLDPLAARHVRELIVNLKRSNRSIILCTHDLDEAERLADEIAIMRKGLIVAKGSATALRAQMSGETQVQVEFAGHSPARLDGLESMEGINAVHYIEVPQEKIGEEAPMLVYQTAQPKVVNPLVLAQLITAGAQIVSVTCESSTLEDVYTSAMNAGSELPAVAETVGNVVGAAILKE